MCAFSMIGDHYHQKWGQGNGFTLQPAMPADQIGRIEFEQLRKEVLEMKELLKRAKEYDERTGQPDCEQDEKIETLKKVAKLVGVDLSELLKGHAGG